MNEHRYTITERVRYGRGGPRRVTFQANCPCGWMSHKHDTERATENEADDHVVTMTSVNRFPDGDR